VLREVLFAVCAFAAVSGAQDADLSKPPDTPPIPTYKLPPIHETKLSNGLQLVLVDDKRFPLVTARLVFQAGSKFDPADQPGLASNVAALLTEGTKARNQRQIAEELASIGGALGGGASMDTLTISGSALSENLSKLLELIADVATNASFPTEEVELRKANRKQALMAQRSQPAFLAEERFNLLVFGENNPYAHIAPTIEALDKLDAKSLISYRDTYIVPNNATLILVGSLPQTTQAVKAVESQFTKWQRKGTVPQPKIDFPVPERRLILVDRPGSVQADIHVGQLAVDRSHSDFFPLNVARVILGGGPSSRMFNEIREKHGYAYDAHTEFDPLRQRGTFKAVTQVRNDVISPAMAALLKEMEGMASEAVGKDELEAAKNYMSGLHLLRLETQAGLADQLATAKGMGLPNSYIEDYTVNLRRTDAAQIQAVSKKYIIPDKATIVVVGDAATLAEPLEKFGKVTVVKP
jgi:zinc protease